VEDALVVIEIGVFPGVDEAGVRPVEAGGRSVMVFGEGAVVKAVGEVEVTSKVVGATVVGGVVPGGDELVTDVAGGFGVSVEVDHLLLSAPDEEGPFFIITGLKTTGYCDLDSDVDDFGGFNRGTFGEGIVAEGPEGAER